MILRKWRILEIERRSTRPQSVENSLWKRLWTCRKTDYVIMRQRLCEGRIIYGRSPIKCLQKRYIVPENRRILIAFVYSVIARLIEMG
jgi:hypothetical protein